VLAGTTAVTMMTVRKVNLALSDGISGFFTTEVYDYFY
jgi:hypothetical protein